MKSYLQRCTQEQFQCILREIGTSEEALHRDVQYLMKWMEKQPHLPSIKDEDILMNALIFNKNRMEKTKRLIDLFYTAKARWPYLCIDRDIVFDQIDVIKRLGYFVPLPKLTPEGDRVIIFRLNKHTPEDLPHWEFIMKSCATVAELVLKIDCFRRVICIADADNMSTAAAAMVVTIATKAPALLAAKHVPARTGNIYIMNLHPIFQWLLTFVKNLLKPKITEKIVIWEKDPECLSKEIPKHILPPEFGGTERPLEELFDDFTEYVKQFRHYAASLADVKADLSKIPDDYGYKGNEIGFGIDGTFRNLLIE